MSCTKKKLLVCMKGKSCPRMNSSAIYHCLKEMVEVAGLQDFYKVKKAKCFDMCKHAPVIGVKPEGVYYGKVAIEQCIDIAMRHLKKKKALKSLTLLKR